MKALSIKQPFAWALFHGKPVENRDWAMYYRGPLIIHASKTLDEEGLDWLNKTFPRMLKFFGNPEFVLGCLLGTVQVVDCVKQHQSPWFFGPYGHVYRDPVEFKTPIPYRGMPGPFDVPDEVVKEALR